MESLLVTVLAVMAFCSVGMVLCAIALTLLIEQTARLISVTLSALKGNIDENF